MRILLLIVVLAGLFPYGATAQLAPTKPPIPIWQDLDPATQKILESHRQRWNDYPPKRRIQLMERAQAILNLPPSKRAELERLSRNFKKLPLERKIVLCSRFKRERGFLPPPCRVLRRQVMRHLNQFFDSQ